MRIGGALAAVIVAGAAAAQANPGCEDPQRFCGEFLSAGCLDQLGAGATGAPRECEGEFADYRGCLELIARGCDGPRRAIGATSAIEGEAANEPMLGPFAIQNVACVAERDGVTCAGLMRNTAGRNSTLQLYATSSSVDRTSRLFTPTGEELEATGIGLGDSLVTTCRGFCYTKEKTVPPDVGIRFQVMFDVPDTLPDRVAVLEVAGEHDDGRGRSEEGKVLVRAAPLRRQ